MDIYYLHSNFVKIKYCIFVYILFEILPSLTYLDKSILKYRFEISFFTIQKNLVSIPEIKIIINILKIRILHYFINPTEAKDAVLLIFSSRKQKPYNKISFPKFLSHDQFQ